MPIEFSCHRCSAVLRVGEDAAGKQAKCPSCGEVSQVPQAVAASPAPPEPTAFDSLQGSSPGSQLDRDNPYAAPGVQPSEVLARGEVRPSVMDLGEVINHSWNLYTGQFGLVLGVVLLSIGISIGVGFVLQGISTAAMFADPQAGNLVSFATSILRSIVDIWLAAGIAIFMLNVCFGRPATINDLFSGAPFLLRIVLAYLLLGLLCLAIWAVCSGPAALIGYLAGQGDGAAIGTIAGSAISAVPIIIVTLTYSQLRFLIIDQKLGVMDAFQMSRTITTGNRLLLFVLYIFQAFVGLAGCLACFIGIIFAIPYIEMTKAVAYVTISGQLSTVTDVETGL